MEANCSSHNLYRRPWTPDEDEHDSCALIANVRKTAEATHGNVKRTLEALAKMGHRTGDVDGEGDGCGVLTDIPRRLWMQILEEAERPGALALDRRFALGHFLIPRETRQESWRIKEHVLGRLRASGFELLAERTGAVRTLALGKRAREQEPEFWQVAGLCGGCPTDQLDHKLYDLLLEIERETPIHVASFSAYSAVYKVRGTVETLYHYYPDLRSPDFLSSITIGHSRYSTNTLSVFERVQPFSLLGHNGELNTIAQLRSEAQMLNTQLVVAGSDSQDLNRFLEELIHHYGFSLLEAMELAFPPIGHEMEQVTPELKALYTLYRQAVGPFAQGPAAIVARYADECVFSVDALGLRPLWYGETEKEYFFSSEKGVVPLDLMVRDPNPLAPGEKMVLRVRLGHEVKVLEYPEVQATLLQLAKARFASRQADVISRQQKQYYMSAVAEMEPAWLAAVGVAQGGGGMRGNLPQRPASARNDAAAQSADALASETTEDQPPARERSYDWGPVALGEHPDRWLAAFGWNRDDPKMLETLAETGSEPIGSLGYDGPLAPLSRERQNLADYFKETVAVVTNPSIDRERETEHFSLQVLIGPRPDLWTGLAETSHCLVLGSPILLGGQPGEPPILVEEERALAGSLGGMRLEDVLAQFQPQHVCRLSTAFQEHERLSDALDRLSMEAVAAVRDGAQVLLLDDGDCWHGGNLWIDPHLAVAQVDRALRLAAAGAPSDSAGKSRTAPANLRRQVGIVVRSGALRTLHDLIMAFGMGANAVNPYLLLQMSALGENRKAEPGSRAARVTNVVTALSKGLEKVISTVGCHELRGYGRLFASMGLAAEVAERFETVNYCGSAQVGRGWAQLEEDARARAAMIHGQSPAQMARTYHFYPKLWKVAGKIATGGATYAEFLAQIESLEEEQPVALRHALGFRFSGQAGPVPADEVDVGIKGNDLPFIISSMSFGSQGETAFRAYAEAAYRLNMVCLNGEGGEISDLIGRYPHNRGQQIASGRFGVNIQLLNASNLLEIKIGQGAKPGEGGHLPGKKVSRKVAAARHARPGVDLISPSNNHDLYSIEDLAQVIEELKTANPRVRVSVKVPVVPGIGIIAVGIAKAGADIINLSGYDGGTGAARKHALQYVGLPAEIGVKLAHRALTQAGIRDRVELWCDGGMKSATDVVKMMCLGANRVGFGTMAMVAIGCTICRACQTDTCHVGIATQMETEEEALSRGVKRFLPQNLESAVDHLCRLFHALGVETQTLVGRLGFRRAQDLVGRSDLLHQVVRLSEVDLSELLEPVTSHGLRVPGAVDRAIRRPRNHLTTLVSQMIMEAVEQGEKTVLFEDDRVNAADRALGTHLAGELARYHRRAASANGDNNRSVGAALRFYASSIAGNGLGAYNSEGVQILIEGGAQDGVGKGALGGKVVILKGMNHNGDLVDGSVGKSFAYGAQGGLFLVQGNADSRACIRLSGAEVVIGGDLREPLQDHLGFLGARANVKGFLCEYMTDGRVVVLGDPGPWICSGMTGGTLYVRLRTELGLDQAAIKSRLAKGAKAQVLPVGLPDEKPLTRLLHAYRDELAAANQAEEAQRVDRLAADWRGNFVKVVPTMGMQVDQEVSTE
ncbi:MAG: alpha-hydroxy-acid oxidizing protein [Anaerolineae bacterium]|nr:alpha-hydroxy-acid oxidizing protein [Anaerolineae bacterium]